MNASGIDSPKLHPLSISFTLLVRYMWVTSLASSDANSSRCSPLLLPLLSCSCSYPLATPRHPVFHPPTPTESILRPPLRFQRRAAASTRQDMRSPPHICRHISWPRLTAILSRSLSLSLSPLSSPTSPPGPFIPAPHFTSGGVERRAPGAWLWRRCWRFCRGRCKKASLQSTALLISAGLLRSAGLLPCCSWGLLW